MKRRDFVSLLSAATASAALNLNPLELSAQQKQPNPSEWLKSGPMLGHCEMTETKIWLQTHKPCRAQVRFWKHGQPAASRLSEAVQTTEDGDLIARFRLTQLEFGNRYDYEIYLDGHRVSFSYNPSFQTQVLWQRRTDPPPFRIAIGSCAWINDAEYDRPGSSYGGNYEIFQTIARQKPDAMIWLGDNCYYREADWLNETAMRYRYAHTRALPEMQELLATVHHYAVWDDHGFGPNNSDRAHRTRETSLRIFKDYWANAVYGTPETPGIFGRFEWNDVEFFLLDDRYYRTPNRTPLSPKKMMFGEARMQWLKDALVASNAPFKLIVGGTQMMNAFAPDEGWSQFPEERQSLIDFIREARIRGVLFTSGDRHFSELIRRVEPGLYPLCDFTSSPLTSGNFKPTREEVQNPARVPGTLVDGVRNFGLIEAGGTPNARKLVLRTLDSTGKEWWRHEIGAGELTFPK